MPELLLQISVSLDGYIEDKDGDLGWFTEDTSLDDLATAAPGDGAASTSRARIATFGILTTMGFGHVTTSHDLAGRIEADARHRCGRPQASTFLS